MMLEEMDRSVHDSLMAVKRVLESKEVIIISLLLE